MGVDIIEPEPLLVHGLEEDRVFHFSRESHCGFGKHRAFSHSILLYYYYYILDSSYRKKKKKSIHMSRKRAILYWNHIYEVLRNLYLKSPKNLWHLKLTQWVRKLLRLCSTDRTWSVILVLGIFFFFCWWLS